MPLSTKTKRLLILYSLLVMAALGFVIHHAIPVSTDIEQLQQVAAGVKIAYIENVEGGGGLYDFYFGEVMVLDPTTLKKYRLTNDRFFDINPTWSSDGSAIVFESSRGNRRIIYDPSTPRDIYSLDLKSGRINSLGLRRFGYDQPKEPYMSQLTNRLAFAGRQQSSDMPVWYYDLAIFDFEQDTIQTLLTGIKGLRNIRWSEDDRFISFTFQPKRGLTTKEHAISLYDTERAEVVATIKRDNWWYETYDLYAGKVLIYAKKLSPNVGNLFVYTIATEEMSPPLLPIGKFDAGVGDAVFASEDKLYLLGSVITSPKNDFQTDIYEFTLSSAALLKLTSDGNHKNGLAINRSSVSNEQ